MVFRFLRSPVATFNRLVPKDRGSRLAVAGERFGPDDRRQLDVYMPRREASEPWPVMIFFYGGSWASGSRRDYGFAGRALAAQGFVTLVPDYRLVPETRFPGFVDDGAAAFRWARAHAVSFGGDPERMVLIGHSAGAYIAAMLALDPQWLGEERGAVRGLVGLAGPYDFLPLSGPATRAAFGEAGDLAATQPVNFARSGSPPALLLHGSSDRTVLPRNSRELAQRLAAAGCEAEARIYSGRNHVDLVTTLALPLRRRAPVLADAAAFARRVCSV
ncbi:MAG TPA: alpha/beta hydrolase [Allosphingosinicella sp.]|jgi:acetyl esterase/lipase